MIINERFKQKRREKCLIIEDAIKNDSSINNVFSKLIKQYSIITPEELEESRESGYITIHDLEINEVIGALYVRKCTSLNKDNYDIELLLDCTYSKAADSLVDAISDDYSIPFCCIKSDFMPDMIILIFKGNNINSKQIYREIAREYGASGRIYLLEEGTVLELKEFSDSKDEFSSKDFNLQDLVKYISRDDEEYFDIEIPNSSIALKLKDKK